MPASELPEDDGIGKPQGRGKTTLPEVLPTITSMQSTDQSPEEAEISTGAMASVAAAAAPESAETHASETNYGRAQEELKGKDSDGGWSEGGVRVSSGPYPSLRLSREGVMVPSRCCKNGGDIKGDKREMMEEKKLGNLGLIALGLGLLVGVLF